MKGRESYLNEEYRNSINSLEESYPDISSETVTEIFLQECDKFEGLFMDDAPLSAIQRTAFTQTKKRITDGDIPETDNQSEN